MTIAQLARMSKSQEPTKLAEQIVEVRSFTKQISVSYVSIIEATLYLLDKRKKTIAIITDKPYTRGFRKCQDNNERQFQQIWEAY